MSEEALADLIANASEMFINSNNLCKGKFYWQPSCSAFSVSKNDIEKVCKYIKNQGGWLRGIASATQGALKNKGLVATQVMSFVIIIFCRHLKIRFSRLEF